MRDASNSDYVGLFNSINGMYDALAKSVSFSEVESIAEESEAVIKQVKEQESFWTSFAAFFSNIFGHITEYQQLQIEADRLEYKLEDAVKRISFTTDLDLEENSLGKLFNLSEDIEKLQLELEEALEKVNAASHELVDDIDTLSIQMDSLEASIENLESECQGIGLESKQIFHIVTETSKLISLTNTMESTILELSYLYHEKFEVLSPIVPQVIRYELAVKRLKELQNDVANKWGNQAVVKDIVQTNRINTMQRIGGIRNGGNTCYLASAVQTLNNIPAYRKAFDPALNPLVQRENETSDSFQQRKLIQRLIDKMVGSINRGRTITTDEINYLRQACFDYKVNDIPTVESLYGFADAAETLERLLDAMDYKFGSYQLIPTKKPSSEEFTIDETADPSEYSSLDELNLPENFAATIEVAGFLYLGQSVPMQQLIDEFWADEQVGNFKIRDTNDNGITFVKKYDSFTVSKKASFDQAPEVIRITVKQDQRDKTRVDNPQTVYPFGNSGPAYHLKAIIEHRGVHYVAHVEKDPGNFLEADDGTVRASQANRGGVAYYYVKQEDTE